jgi:chemotaxis protein CheZ
VQRKIFRIERMLDDRMAAQPLGTAAPAKLADPKAPRAPADRSDAADVSEPALRRELTLLQDTIARNNHELAALIGEDRERRLAQAAGNLGAAIEGMEKATVKILKSTEAIDDRAKALAAALKTDYLRGLVHDIQDDVVSIYEACNFQDLAGQRIGSVIAILNMIEDQVAGILDRGTSPSGDAAAKPFSGNGLLNGPRLDGASGHNSQSDIDILFD